MKFRFLGILLSLTVVFASLGTPVVCYASESGEEPVEQEANVIVMLEDTTPIENEPQEETPAQPENLDEPENSEEVEPGDDTENLEEDDEESTNDELLGGDAILDDAEASDENSEETEEDELLSEINMLLNMGNSDERLTASLDAYQAALVAYKAAKEDLEAERDEIVNYEMPTIASGQHPYNYIADPEQLITATNAVRYGGASFEPDASMYFENEAEGAEYQYSHLSDYLEITDESNVPVKITVQLQVKTSQLSLASDKEALAACEDASMYFAVVDSEGNEYPVDETGLATIEELIDPIVELDEEGNEIVTAQQFSFAMTGACNYCEGWENITECPAVTMSWAIEPQLEDQDERAARLLAKEQALEDAKLALDQARASLSDAKDKAGLDDGLDEIIDLTLENAENLDATAATEQTELEAVEDDNENQEVLAPEVAQTEQGTQDENLVENSDSAEQITASETVAEQAPVVESTPVPAEEPAVNATPEI